MKIKQETKINNKKAISLIVLVITIIVMMILSGAIVITLNNSGIIDKASEAVDITNETNVRAVAQLAWSEAYLNTDKTQKELEDYVLNKLEEQKINIDEYAIKVTENGVTVVKSVVDIVDTVPIPKGFIASQATGENTKDGGLVIYEGTTPVTDDNVDDAKRTRNQYVWVPVNAFEAEFVRGAYDNVTYSNVLGSTKRWETVLNLTANTPLKEQNIDYMTPQTLAEVQAMYESVKEYKGFYIARYEAGLDIDKRKTSDDGVIIKEVHSKMNKAPYNFVRWTYNNAINEDTNGAVEVARSIYPESNENYGVVSTLTYAVQWDRILAWWVEEEAQYEMGETRLDSATKLNDSKLYGVYYNNAISNERFNSGARVSKNDGETYINISSTYSKTTSQKYLFTTGATEEARINNIYDMAGNLWEWTMEGSDTNKRIIRGGCYYSNGSTYSVSSSYGYSPNYATSYYGFRPALYIKK